MAREPLDILNDFVANTIQDPYVVIKWKSGHFISTRAKEDTLDNCWWIVYNKQIGIPTGNRIPIALIVWRDESFAGAYTVLPVNMTMWSELGRVITTINDAITLNNIITNQNDITVIGKMSDPEISAKLKQFISKLI